MKELEKMPGRDSGREKAKSGIFIYGLKYIGLQDRGR